MQPQVGMVTCSTLKWEEPCFTRTCGVVISKVGGDKLGLTPEQHGPWGGLDLGRIQEDQK